MGFLGLCALIQHSVPAQSWMRQAQGCVVLPSEVLGLITLSGTTRLSILDSQFFPLPEVLFLEHRALFSRAMQGNESLTSFGPREMVFAFLSYALRPSSCGT